MKQKISIGKILSIFIMPLSLVIAMAIMYVVKQLTGISYYDLTYDFKQFYVFSAPTILFFSGALAVPRLWDKENKKQSRKLLAISFLLNAIVLVGITATRNLWDDIYLINPFESASIDGLISVIGSEYAIFLPIYIIWFLLTACLIMVVPALLGAFLFTLKKKAVKIPALLAVLAALITVATLGIVDYESSKIFYDVKGNAYTNHFDVLYYDESGKSYKINEVHDYYFDDQANDVKVTCEDGEYYLGECYISEETGLLVTDENCELIIPCDENRKLTVQLDNKELEEKNSRYIDDETVIFKYFDRQGNEYRPLARAVYDKNGKLKKNYRYLTTDEFTSLRDDANADFGYYYYDLRGNRYVLGQYIMYYDADGNTYKRQNTNAYADYNSNYDIYNPKGEKIGTVDAWDCSIEADTGYIISDDKYERDYDRDCNDGFYDVNGKKYYSVIDVVYDKNGKPSYDDYMFRMDDITW